MAIVPPTTDNTLGNSPSHIHAITIATTGSAYIILLIELASPKESAVAQVTYAIAAGKIPTYSADKFASIVAPCILWIKPGENMKKGNVPAQVTYAVNSIGL